MNLNLFGQGAFLLCLIPWCFYGVMWVLACCIANDLLRPSMILITWISPAGFGLDVSSFPVYSKVEVPARCYRVVFILWHFQFNLEWI